MAEPVLSNGLNATTVLVDVHIPAGRGEKPAILCGQRAVTYRGLCEGVNRLGNALKELGVRMEERVAILLPDSPEFAFAFFGAMKIGAVAIPLNTLLTAPEYEYLLNDSRARELIVDSSLLDHIAPIRENLKYLAHVVVSEGRGAWDGGRGTSFPRPSTLAPRPPQGSLSLEGIMRSASASLEAAKTSKDEAAFWLYSSGTTGPPKGAIHLHHDMVVAADLYARQTLGLTESDVSFSVAKLFFAYGLGNGLYFPLRVGATTVLLPDRPTPDKVFEVIDRHQPTVFYSVPTSYAALLHRAEQNGRAALGRIRLCVSAGEPLPKAIYEKWAKRFGVQILDGIGTTEILHIFISNRPGRGRPGSTGQLVPGYEAKIVDDDGKELPPGQVGNLLIRGDSIAIGYWNKHEATKNTFRGEWFSTGDKYKVDQDGYFWYSGRADDMMKVSGYSVWPSDIEHVLQGHSAVLESGVVGVPDEEGLIKPCAFVVLKDGHKPAPELAHELQDFVKTHAAPYKYPRWIKFVHTLPKTATGKILRYKLREMAR
jgi:benzoate-CoA ligase